MFTLRNIWNIQILYMKMLHYFLEKKSIKEWAYAFTIKTHGLAKSSKPTAQARRDATVERWRSGSQA